RRPPAESPQGSPAARGGGPTGPRCRRPPRRGGARSPGAGAPPTPRPFAAASRGGPTPDARSRDIAGARRGCRTRDRGWCDRPPGHPADAGPVPRGRGRLRRRRDNDAARPPALGERAHDIPKRPAPADGVRRAESPGELDAIGPEVHADDDTALEPDELGDELADDAETEDGDGV